MRPSVRQKSLCRCITQRSAGHSTPLLLCWLLLSWCYMTLHELGWLSASVCCNWTTRTDSMDFSDCLLPSLSCFTTADISVKSQRRRRRCQRVVGSDRSVALEWPTATNSLLLQSRSGNIVVIVTESQQTKQNWVQSNLLNSGQYWL